MRTNINPDNLILPYFVTEGSNGRERIRFFPQVYRLSTDKLLREIDQLNGLGLNKILLFGVPQKKDRHGTSAYSTNNLVSRAVQEIKKRFKNIVVMTDVCLCAYASHGHCGVIKPEQKTIDHKSTLDALSKMALSHAEAGADYVAPSAMARRQVFAIRSALDSAGFGHTKIMGYSAKFASNFYGPFREAANSAPKFGDRSAYQLDFHDPELALKKISDDIKEGADIVMVKPALSYLDIIRQAKERFNAPLAAFNVSGEYALVKHGASLGLWDEKKAVFEIITSIKRAGADFIITYHAKDIAKWLRER